jgi:L-aspartate oxidase
VESFPQALTLCRRGGYEPLEEPVPVAPAAHYHMGGVVTDEHGRTGIDGLWACGEVAMTGVHGANRLASNSLLEALVFGARVAEDLAVPRRRAPAAPEPDGGIARIGEISGSQADPAADAALTAAVRALRWEKVGVERDGRGLGEAVDRLDRLASENPGAAGEAKNLLAAARMVSTAALARRESRGGHFRTDYPAPDPAWRRHLQVTLDAGGAVRVKAGELEPDAADAADAVDTDESAAAGKATAGASSARAVAR